MGLCGIGGGWSDSFVGLEVSLTLVLGGKGGGKVGCLGGADGGGGSVDGCLGGTGGGGGCSLKCWESGRSGCSLSTSAADLKEPPSMG